MTQHTPTIGETVQFVFSRTPATFEGKRIFAQRARNMADMRRISAECAAYKGGWINGWCIGKVTEVLADGYRVEGYFCKPEDVAPYLTRAKARGKT